MTISSRYSLSLSAVVALLLAALLSAGMVATAPPAGASAGSFTSLLNSERTSRGLAPLDSNSDLAAVASTWAASMASSGKLAHNPKLTSQVSGWRFVGENVGYGPDAATIHRALMDSPGHRANILDKQYTQVGIGVAQADGRVWVAQVFRTPSGASAKPKPAAAPAPEPKPKPAHAPKPKPAPAPTPKAAPVPKPAPQPVPAAAPEAAENKPAASADQVPAKSSSRPATPVAAPAAVPPPPSPEELLRGRAATAASGPGVEAVTDPVQQSLRFVEVMRAVHG